MEPTTQNQKDVRIEIAVPSQLYAMAEEYAKVCNTNTKTILRKALISRLKDLNNLLKHMPYKPKTAVINKWEIY
ncbi:MAG: hypothetical protein PHH85_12600 [Candidatus Methanoperedens sp.]|nr:hypothetical protein [Candidatus Methanoperedens sp.]